MSTPELLFFTPIIIGLWLMLFVFVFLIAREVLEFIEKRELDKAWRESEREWRKKMRLED